MPVDHYENFPVASWLLPQHLRHPVEVIYAFARSADDFADEGALSPDERIQLLDGYIRHLDEIRAGQTPQAPLFQSLANIIREHALPIGLFYDLLDAFKQDVHKTRYANFDELKDYCRRSADPIGRLLLHLYQQATPQHLTWSDAICSSLQLINHWQDVAIDWKKNTIGRVYLPQDELQQFGLSDHDIAQANAGDAWQKCMSFQCARARAMMVRGAPLGQALHGRIGAELRLIIAGGLRILDKIEAVKGDVFNHRPALKTWDWMVMAPRALPSFSRLPT